MANAMGEAISSPLRLQFDPSVRLPLRGSAISSDGSLLLHRELDDGLDLTGIAVKLIADQLAGDVPNGKCRLKLSRRLGAYCRPWEGNMRISPSVTWGGCSSANTIVRATSSASKTAGKRS